MHALLDDGSRDMLVRLYRLPDITELLKELDQSGFTIRRALACERSIVLDWVARDYQPSWVDECTMSFASQPVKCMILVAQGRMLGFCCYDATALGTAGPVAIDAEYRGRGGLMRALIVSTMYALRDAGYHYAVLGWVPPRLQRIYKRMMNAETLADAHPLAGAKRGMLFHKMPMPLSPG